jgi:hypothetical protein
MSHKEIFLKSLEWKNEILFLTIIFVIEMTEKNTLYRGKTVVNIMQWEVVEWLKTQPKLNYTNRQFICSISSNTSNSYDLNMHKMHRSAKNGLWYYVDSEIDIPIGKIRIIETVNKKNGFTDYVYDPTWMPLNQIMDIKEKFEVDNTVNYIDKMIAELQSIKNTESKEKRIEELRAFSSYWNFNG